MKGKDEYPIIACASPGWRTSDTCSLAKNRIENACFFGKSKSYCATVGPRGATRLMACYDMGMHTMLRRFYTVRLSSCTCVATFCFTLTCTYVTTSNFAVHPHAQPKPSTPLTPDSRSIRSISIKKKGRLLPVRETECLDLGVLPRSLRATSTHECAAALV